MIGIQAFIDDVPRDKEGKKNWSGVTAGSTPTVSRLLSMYLTCAFSKRVLYQFLTFTFKF